MKNPRLWGFMLVLAGGVAWWLAGAAPEPDWKPLFDGRYPVLFRGYQKSTFPLGSWSVWQGMIRVVPEGEKVDLLIRQRLTNFEFSVEWKAGPGASSGIVYLTRETAGHLLENGLKLALADDEGNLEAKNHPECRSGALYGILPPDKGAAAVKPTGQWNETRLVVQTNHVEHWLNGIKVLEFNLESESFKTAVSKSRFKDAPDFGRFTDGYLVLEHGGKEFWFRQPRLRAWTTAASGESHP